MALCRGTLRVDHPMTGKPQNLLAYTAGRWITDRIGMSNDEIEALPAQPKGTVERLVFEDRTNHAGHQVAVPPASE